MPELSSTGHQLEMIADTLEGGLSQDDSDDEVEDDEAEGQTDGRTA